MYYVYSILIQSVWIVHGTWGRGIDIRYKVCYKYETIRKETIWLSFPLSVQQVPWRRPICLVCLICLARTNCHFNLFIVNAPRAYINLLNDFFYAFISIVMHLGIYNVNNIAPGKEIMNWK